MKQITCEQLSGFLTCLFTEFSSLFIRIENIERHLLQERSDQSTTDQWMDLDGLCTYLPEKPAKATIYAWVAKNEIPYHKRNKRLYFLQSEIDTWLKEGRKKTVAELQAAAEESLIKSKRRDHDR